MVLEAETFGIYTGEIEEDSFYIEISSGHVEQIVSDDQQKDVEEESQLGNPKYLTNVPEPPNGGWGWVIVAASFFSNLVVDGIIYSFAIFFPHLIHYYDAPKSKVAWVGSLLSGCNLCIGPLASALINRFGCRAVAITGCVISCCSLLFSTLAPNIDILIFTCGVMGGIGFGLTFLPSVVIVGYYFSTKRALATGIAVCGSGVGAFVFAPLCQMLLDIYGWKGAMMLLAGLSLNCVVFGCLMRPLDTMVDSKLLPQNIPEKKIQQSTDSICNGRCNEPLKMNYFLNITSNNQMQKNNANSILYLSTFLCDEQKSNEFSETLHSTENFTRSTYHENTNNGSSRHLVVNKQSKDYIDSPIDNVTFVSHQNDVSEDVSDCKSNMQVYSNFKMLDFSLLKNKAFLIMCIYNVITMIGFFVPYFFITDSSVAKGISATKAASLLSAIGAANTFGRVFFGWLSDRAGVNTLFVNNISLLMTGICIIIVPFCTSYVTLVINSLSFGFFASACICLTSPILIDLLGLEKITYSFGLINLFRGTACIVGVPIAGFIYDVTGSYNLPFYVAGILVTISSVLSFMVPWVDSLYPKDKKPPVNPETVHNMTLDVTEDDQKSAIQRRTKATQRVQY